MQPKFTRVENCHFAEIDGEKIVYNSNNGMCVLISDIAVDIWHRLAEPKTLVQLVEILVQAYAVSKAQCEQDVHGFIEELQASELIQAG